MTPMNLLTFRERGAIDPRVMRLADRNGHAVELLCAMTTEQLEATAAAYAASCSTPISAERLLILWRRKIASAVAPRIETEYQYETGDYAALVSGQIVGYAATHSAAYSKAAEVARRTAERTGEVRG